MLIQEITNAILRKKCILFLGSNFAMNEKGEKIHDILMNYLKNKADSEIEFEIDNIFLPKNPDQMDGSTFYTLLSDFYKEIKPQEFYNKIAQIPFHLIVNTTPDRLLPNTYEDLNIDYEFDYYSKNGKIKNKEFLINERPSIYNLFGNIEDQNSMILNYEDLFNFVISIMGGDEKVKEKLPQNFLKEIATANAFLFLGFNMERWYIKLLFHKLNFGKEVVTYKGYTNRDSVKNKHTENYIKYRHKIIKIDDSIIQIIDRIFMEVKNQNKLRTIGLKKENSIFKELESDLKNNHLQEVIDKILELSEYKFKDIYKDMISLSGRFHELERKKARRAIYENDAEIETNKIRENLTHYINELEKKMK